MDDTCLLIVSLTHSPTHLHSHSLTTLHSHHTLTHTHTLIHSHTLTIHTHSLTHRQTHTHLYSHSLAGHTHTHTHSLIHILTHTLAHSLTNSLTHSLTHPPTHSPTHPLTHPPTGDGKRDSWSSQHSWCSWSHRCKSSLAGSLKTQQLCHRRFIQCEWRKYEFIIKATNPLEKWSHSRQSQRSDTVTVISSYW